MARRPSSRISRRGAQRSPKKRFFICCEGENTEPAYFLALKNSLPDALIEVVTIKIGGVPKTVVARAKKERKKHSDRNGKTSSFEEGDEYWAVFDRDDHDSYYGAIDQCNSTEIGIACSNPCFELWLILHIEDFDKSVNRKAVQKQLKKLCPEYNPKKAKVPDCNKLVECVEAAEKRAKLLLKKRAEEQPGKHPNPPYTCVGDLTAKIREAAKKSAR